MVYVRNCTHRERTDGIGVDAHAVRVRQRWNCYRRSTLSSEGQITLI